MAGQIDMGQLLADQLVKAAKLVEEQLDVELNKLDNMDEDEMESLVGLSTRYDKISLKLLFYNIKHQSAFNEWTFNDWPLCRKVWKQ